MVGSNEVPFHTVTRLLHASIGQLADKLVPGFTAAVVVIVPLLFSARFLLGSGSWALGLLECCFFGPRCWVVGYGGCFSFPSPNRRNSPKRLTSWKTQQAGCLDEATFERLFDISAEAKCSVGMPDVNSNNLLQQSHHLSPSANAQDKCELRNTPKPLFSPPTLNSEPPISLLGRHQKRAMGPAMYRQAASQLQCADKRPGSCGVPINSH